MRRHESVGRIERLAALILLFLLLSPYLNLIPITLAAANNAATVQQPDGQPLPPGTVSYTNTWNSTLSLKCNPPTTQNEALTPRSGNWTMSESIPSLLFQGSPAGPNFTQKYVLFLNGTLLATDNAGNRLVLSGLSGLSGGVAKTKLFANSTVAYLTTLITWGPLVLANVTEAFSVRRQDCQPAGLRLEILGSASWGLKGSGTLSIGLKTRPTALDSSAAWFGSRPGQTLGFDWNDSLAMNPEYDAAAGVLSYSVGQSFFIDPVIVGTAQQWGLANGYQGRLFYANGYDWLFYYDGTHFGYRSSPDWTTWSSEYTISTGSTATSAECASFYLSATTAYYAIMSPCNDQGSQTVYYRSGTLGAGTISWGPSRPPRSAGTTPRAGPR
ncbi:MAG: hypothetical protein HY296_03065 [Thaumarchaeota archaeon]|nr:hypothetical protein [Nitrososphaerota archaeon]